MQVVFRKLGLSAVLCSLPHYCRTVSSFLTPARPHRSSSYYWGSYCWKSCCNSATFFSSSSSSLSPTRLSGNTKKSKRKNNITMTSDKDNETNHVGQNEPGRSDDQHNDEKSSSVPPKQPQKFHHYTICMVPPEANAGVAWEELSKARAELRDPGFFRWPPHANLLYPFIDPHQQPTTETTVTEEPSSVKAAAAAADATTSTLDAQVLEKLRNACQKMEPFAVRLDRLGTFGGARRGVLWIYPTSFHDETPPSLPGGAQSSSSSADSNVEPLIQLQDLLQEEFPYCNDQQKVGNNAFAPHMTLSHFVNLDAALEAQAQIETWWDPSITFTVDEIYLLHRKGDAGQFERLATFGLGESGLVQTHEPDTLAFDFMPRVEADWVREERMKLKQRRNKGSRVGGGGRGRRRRERNESRPPSTDTPEVIAQKRAERKAKREAKEREAAAGLSAPANAQQDTST